MDLGPQSPVYRTQRNIRGIIVNGTMQRTLV